MKDAKKRFADLALEQNNAEIELKKAQDLADEAEELTKKLAEERAKMSWWLLIIAIFGATGYAGYRNHQKKLEGEDTEA